MPAVKQEEGPESDDPANMPFSTTMVKSCSSCVHISSLGTSYSFGEGRGLRVAGLRPSVTDVQWTAASRADTTGPTRPERARALTMSTLSDATKMHPGQRQRQMNNH